MTKGRFAPSPTGRMHLGNVFSALLSWLSAKSKGGEWLLRIEDIDPQRSRREYAQWLMDDLTWLGLTWDGEPVYQSQRSDIYEHYYTFGNGVYKGILSFVSRSGRLTNYPTEPNTQYVVYEFP